MAAARSAIIQRDDWGLPLKSSETFLDGRVTLHPGDCLDVLARLDECSVDSVVCDPPYHLTSIVKRFGAENAAPAKSGKTGAYKRASAGFMGRKWDAPEEAAIDPGFAYWFAGFVDGEGCFSVHKKTVNECETYDCQFSITLRADDRAILADIQRELGGIGSLAERPAPKEGNGKPQVRYCISSKRDCQRLREILLVFPLRAKKARDFEIWSHALDAWKDHRPGAGWGDVAYFRNALMDVRRYGSDFNPSQLQFYRFARQCYRVLKPGGHLVAFGGTRTYHRLASGIEDAGFEIRDTIAWIYGSGFPKSHNIGDGWGTALKPAWEPICLARKPLIGTVAANMQEHGTGAINVDGCRVAVPENEPESYMRGERSITMRRESSNSVTLPATVLTDKGKGRWPANIIHDGSEEVVAAFPDGRSAGDYPSDSWGTGDGVTFLGKKPQGALYADQGSAARFFYTAKADDYDRIGSKHPTVKPVDLMQWLVRLVTPKGGLVLDPFAGTGTTGEAAWREGMRAVLIEREAEYQDDIRRRMKLCLAGPDEKRRESLKARGLVDDAGPLFGGNAETRGGADRFTESSRTKNRAGRAEELKAE